MFRAQRAYSDVFAKLCYRHGPVLLAGILLLSLAACGGVESPSNLSAKKASDGVTMSFRGSPAEKREQDSAMNTESYAHIAENPFQLAVTNPLSTFSIDVDTASYSNIRRFLVTENKLPPKDAVRIEELINYFRYEYPEPRGEHPIAIATEVAACPWDSRLKLVRIGLQSSRISSDSLPPRNLVFLLDTSGSMNYANKLPLLKESLGLLVNHLTAKDRVAIVAYAGSAGLILPSTPGSQQNVILSALNRLHAGGSTNGGEGIELAYRVAQENFIEGGVNRVIIGTDGDFNVGTTSEGDLVRLIEEKRKGGVFLSVLGFGMGNLKDSTMEKLAHHGNGHYAYIDSLAEARRIFVEQGAAMLTVANDVKVQVEFNPARVHAYRLIGYENRLMRDQDFNDDSKDAGDMGAGHSVTALYAIAPLGVDVDVPKTDDLKYQQKPDLSKAAQSSELLTVKIRYKLPGDQVSNLITQAVTDMDNPFDKASEDFRFAAAVAEFGMLLRDSKYKGQATYADAFRTARQAATGDFEGRREEFLQLVQMAVRLSEPKGE